VGNCLTRRPPQYWRSCLAHSTGLVNGFPGAGADGSQVNAWHWALLDRKVYDTAADSVADIWYGASLFALMRQAECGQPIAISSTAASTASRATVIIDRPTSSSAARSHTGAPGRTEESN
jgi:hypothetical protein